MPKRRPRKAKSKRTSGKACCKVVTRVLDVLADRGDLRGDAEDVLRRVGC